MDTMIAADMAQMTSPPVRQAGAGLQALIARDMVLAALMQRAQSGNCRSPRWNERPSMRWQTA